MFWGLALLKSCKDRGLDRLGGIDCTLARLQAKHFNCKSEYVYRHVCAYIHIDIYVYAYEHTYMQTCIQTDRQTHAQTKDLHIYVYMYVYICLYNIYIYIDVCIYIYMYVYIYMYYIIFYYIILHCIIDTYTSICGGIPRFAHDGIRGWCGPTFDHTGMGLHESCTTP